MRLNGKSGFGLLLIAFGILILLDIMGINVGNVIGVIFPAALIGLGYIGIKKGRSFIGWVLVIVGVAILLGKLSGLFGIIIAGALLYFGISLLRKSSRTV